ncbi:hypothetical protein [Rhodoplanes sp. Z2-YC6860]|uniref:hypothetical protein n=1 Tax=Rhodoplanes sp. Z2-YC6860 TaxID=674703 RepID=UPI00078E9414|nr:hypothetical protein [Rhodoplanes sp. Z2-YC6860]AMN44054.1 hypothetical protein RHPLAN_56380 [Rhodoplanes sp. Z2-YC6860]
MPTLVLRKFTDPDFLSTVDQSCLQAFLRPWSVYLAAHGLKLDRSWKSADWDALKQCLIDPNENAPHDLIDALYYIHETSTDEDMDALLFAAAARGISIRSDLMTSPADVTIQVWVADPEMVRERHAQNVAFRQKNFLYYGGLHAGAASLPIVEGHVRSDIERSLDDWFDQHNRGRGCRAFFFPRKERLWILIRHGLPTRREAKHLDNGSSDIEVYRPQQHDVLIYDQGTDELGVHAGTQGERKLYLLTLGRLLFGDEDYFPPADKFTLQPLVDHGAQSLLCEDIPGIERIRLVEYRRSWGGAYQDIEIRKGSDIFGSLAARSRTLVNSGRLSSATFKVKFADSSKERSVTIRPPCVAKYERNEDSEAIDLWLTRRGFVLEQEGDADDQTPHPLVASAG